MSGSSRSSPLFGVLLLACVRFDTVYGLSAAGSLLIAVGIFVGALLVTRSRPLALRLGRPRRHHRLPSALFIVSWRHTRRQTVPHPAQQ